MCVWQGVLCNILTANLQLINLLKHILRELSLSVSLSFSLCTYLDELERGNGRQSLALRVVETARRMGGIARCDAIDDTLRCCRPIGCGEGETVVGARIKWIQFNGDSVNPRAANAKLQERIHIEIDFDLTVASLSPRPPPALYSPQTSRRL